MAGTPRWRLLLADGERRERVLRRRLEVALAEVERTRLERARLAGARQDLEARADAIRDLEEAQATALARAVEAEAEVESVRGGLGARIRRLEANPREVPRRRRPLPDERESITLALRVGDRETGIATTLHVGLYPDGLVGEVFLRFSDGYGGGTQAAAMADYACILMSMMLQYGIPLKDRRDAAGEVEETGLLSKMLYATDASAGWTFYRPDPDVDEYEHDYQVGRVASLRDYIAKKIDANTDAGGVWVGPRGRPREPSPSARRAAREGT